MVKDNMVHEFREYVVLRHKKKEDLFSRDSDRLPTFSKNSAYFAWASNPKTDHHYIDPNIDKSVDDCLLYT